MWAFCFTVLRHAVFDGFAQCFSSREVCFFINVGRVLVSNGSPKC